LIDCIDEAAGHDFQNLVEKTSTLLALALLKDESAGQQRKQRQANEHAFSGSGHTV
jgi:hypothetical protein